MGISTTSILRPGDVLGGFCVEELIGIGGTAIVYRAEQLSLGRPVALKVLAPQQADDEAFRTRFRREGKHLAVLEHPNIVPVYDCGESDGLLFIAMRLVDGTNLAQMIRSDGLSAERMLHLLQPIAGALDAAHAEELVHRDVKPQNILVTSRDHPYLADFGVAKGSNTFGLTATGGFVGSVNYASPEQINGSTLTNASDIYAFTAVLYHCLTGNVPYVRESDAAVMQAHLSDPPPRLTSAGGDGQDLGLAIARGMAKDPSVRFQSARELLETVARSVARLPAERRLSVPAFPDQTTASQRPYARKDTPKLGSQASGRTVADHRRRVEADSAVAPPQRQRRWTRLVVVLGGLAIAVLAVGLIAMSKGTVKAAAVHHETLDLAPILGPVSTTRASITGYKPHDASGLAEAERRLAVRDAEAVTRVSKLRFLEPARSASVANLTSALTAEAVTMRALASAAQQMDDAAYDHVLKRFPSTQEKIAGALKRAESAGFSATPLPAVSVGALTLPKPKRRKTHHRPRHSSPSAGGSAPAANSSGYTQSAEPRYVPEPVHESSSPEVSHGESQHSDSAPHYGPRVVAPPVG